MSSTILQVFPRPKLDEALEARRLEREEATRQAKASLSNKFKGRGFGRVGSAVVLGPAGARGGEAQRGNRMEQTTIGVSCVCGASARAECGAMWHVAVR